MCGRYDLSRNAQAIFRFFGVEPVSGWEPGYNIAPSRTALIVHAGDAGEPVAAASRWGFEPRYAEDRDDAPAPINARAEKVASSPYFRGAFARRRAIVPADGWYEWRQEADGKQPYRFTRHDGGLLLFAGIWTASAEPPGKCFAILTEPARSFARQIHPRMPVVVDDACWRSWIDATLADREAVRAAVAPLPVDALDAYPVSRRVGNPRNDDPGLIEPQGESIAGT